MKLPIHVRRNAANGLVQAYCPDLPGCSASAATEDEVLRLLRLRIDQYFAASARRAPAGTRIVTLEV